MADTPALLPLPASDKPSPGRTLPEYIVGIGASVGGLEAFSTFFHIMPPDSGLAFVLVQHLAPQQPSLLPELLASQTPMAVHAVQDQMAVQPNQIYIIPPNTTLTIHQGVLVLAAPSEPHGHRMAINHFLQSLATDQGDRAIGIICSGADSDGTLGLAAIQEAGGLTLAQDPEEALFPAMPRSAISHRVVDHVLPIVEMPAFLRAYLAQGRRQLPPVRGSVPPEDTSAGLLAICAILRRATGHDFSQYKPSTLKRRIARRMQLAQITDLDLYIEHLRQDRHEAILLFQDFLISVTSFFRDPAAFDALASKVIPTLIRDKGIDTPLRVWVIACATGEEAYSVAMLIQEQVEQMESSPLVQLFATDIDEMALAVARQGRYDPDIAAHMSPERLARFFVLDGDAYQVGKDLRKLCIFSAHNLISDPPFARMDLIVCRNLLIYFTAELQAQLAPLLHYALVPGGYLLLGSAESMAAYPELFQTVDLAQRLFQRNTVHIRTLVPFPLGVASRRPDRLLALARREEPVGPLDLGVTIERVMLQEYTPPAVVIDARGQIVYFFGQVSAYVELPTGNPHLDLRTMIRPDLRLALHAALHALRQTQTAARSDAIIVGDSGPLRLSLTARPLSAPASDLTLVVFQVLGPASVPEAMQGEAGLPPAATIAERLADELQTTRAALETTIVELQEANADLMTANEELLSTNEELQAANEEFQTSKEEIQSINEELQTVNAELNRKIEELDRANADLANLFTSTQIPAIFLHTDGRIARFTPGATEVFRLMAVDLGRPITDIAARFHTSDLLALIGGVLRSLRAHEEVIYRPEPEAWWMMHIRPYQTLANVIDGVVMTFTNITSLKWAEAERERLLREMQTARIYAEQIVATVVEPLLILDAHLGVQAANPAYYQRFAATPAQTEQRPFFSLEGGVWDQPALRAQLDALAAQQADVMDLEMAQTFPAMGARILRLQARLIERPGESEPRILLAINDITELTRTALDMQASRDALEQRVEERTRELADLNAALHAEVAEHRRSEQARQHLLQQMVTAQEEERRRLARELHDQLGQDLTGLILGLKALQDSLSADTAATGRVRQLQELAMQIGQEVRTLAVRLRPAALDDLGLTVALTNYVEQWSARALVAADLHMAKLDDPRLPLAVESTLYRIVQEALTNVLKHAQANRVSLIIERRLGEVRLIVEDDGVGFEVGLARDHAPTEQRLGLLGMDERISQLSGRLTIESAPGSGTTVFVSLPLPPNTAGATDDDATHLSG